MGKHIAKSSSLTMILKLLITRGIITLIPKEANQEKEKENLKIEKNKKIKERKSEKIIKNEND